MCVQKTRGAIGVRRVWRNSTPFPLWWHQVRPTDTQSALWWLGHAVNCFIFTTHYQIVTGVTGRFLQLCNSLNFKASNIQLIIPSLNHYFFVLIFRLFCHDIGYHIARIIFEKLALESHIDIDSCGWCRCVSQQLFDDFNLDTFLNQEASAGVS